MYITSINPTKKKKKKKINRFIKKKYLSIEIYCFVYFLLSPKIPYKITEEYIFAK